MEESIESSANVHAACAPSARGIKCLRGKLGGRVGGGAPHHNGGRGGDENVFWRKPFEAQLQLLINLQAHTLLVATAECSDSLSLSLSSSHLK